MFGGGTKPFVTPEAGDDVVNLGRIAGDGVVRVQEGGNSTFGDREDTLDGS